MVEKEKDDVNSPSTNLAAWISGLGILSYGVLYFLLGFNVISVIASSLTMGMALIVAATWSPTTLRAIRRGSREGPDLLSLAIFLVSLGIVMNRAFALYYAANDRPIWLQSSIFSPLGPWTYLWGLGIILLAPGTSRGEVPNMNFVYVLIGVAIGSAVAGASLTYFLALNLN